MKYSFKTDRQSIETVFNSLRRNHNLDDYAKQFVHYVGTKFKQGAGLTATQLNKLSEFWERY